MGQNSFFKTIELLVNVVELSVNSIKFHFFERLLFLSHVMIRPNFREFHQFFFEFFENRWNQPPPFFFAPNEFSNTARMLALPQSYFSYPTNDTVG
jgi:hypothetical protein